MIPALHEKQTKLKEEGSGGSGEKKGREVQSGGGTYTIFSQ
jgi:hypothetical protein